MIHDEMNYEHLFMSRCFQYPVVRDNSFRGFSRVMSVSYVSYGTHTHGNCTGCLGEIHCIDWSGRDMCTSGSYKDHDFEYTSQKHRNQKHSGCHNPIVRAGRG